METTETWDEPAHREASFAEKLVARPRADLRSAPLRIVTASALAWGFGLAASLGAPAVARFGEALAIAAVPLAFALFYAPSLFVLLTLADVDVDASRVASASVRAVTVSGLVLGGLAPAVAFFELTGGVSAARFSAFLELVALTAAGILALRTFARDVTSGLNDDLAAAKAFALVVGVAILGIVLGARIYPSTLDHLHGGFRHEHHGIVD